MHIIYELMQKEPNYKHQTKAPWTDNLSQIGQTECSPWTEE
jgi:hypothetical protein